MTAFDHTSDEDMLKDDILEPDSIDKHGNRYHLYAEYEKSQGFLITQVAELSGITSGEINP